MKTRDEIETLKRNWYADPCYDIETVEGFEEHAAELLAFRLASERCWKVADELAKNSVERNRNARCAELGIGVALLAYLESLERRIAELERE